MNFTKYSLQCDELIFPSMLIIKSCAASTCLRIVSRSISACPILQCFVFMAITPPFTKITKIKTAIARKIKTCHAFALVNTVLIVSHILDPMP